MPMVRGRAAVVQVPGDMRVIVPDQFSPILDAGPWVDDVLPLYVDDAEWLAEAMRAGKSTGIVEVGPDYACVTIWAESMRWDCEGRDTGWLSSAEAMHRAAAAVALVPEIRRDLQDPECDEQTLATLVALRGQVLEGIFDVDAEVGESFIDMLPEVHRYELHAPKPVAEFDGDDELWS